MDEENKKINIDSFFNRVEEVSQVAGNALKQSNLNTSAIQANKTLINSLSITIEAMKTEIRDIANYIVIEKKLEKDLEEDRKLEAEDARQKQEMIDRAQALSQPTQKKDSVSPPPQQGGGGGGGFLGGLLKAIAIGGIAALALPLIPVLIPKLLLGMAAGIGAIALGVVGKELFKLIPKIGKKIKEGYDASIKFATDIKNKLGDRINVLKSSIGDFLSNTQKKFLDTAGKIINLGKEKIGQVKDLAIDIKDKVVDRSTKFLKSAKEKAENVAGFAKEGFKNTRNFLSGVGKNIMGIKDNINEKITDTKEDVSEFIQDQRENVVGASKTITESIKEGGRGIFNISKNILSTAREKTLSTVAGAADFATGGRFDFDKKGSSDTDNVSPLGKIINAVAPPQTPQVDTSAIAPANKPNTSEVIIRPTSPTIPFIRTVKNQYLSTNPNTNKLPPEIARMIQ